MMNLNKNKNNNNNNNNINKFYNNNNLNLTKNVYNDKIIDKRMLPLFKTPVILKKLIDKKRNKYNTNLSIQKKKIRFKTNTFKELLNLFLKGLTLYKNKLSNYLNKHNNQDLILYLKKDENYKLNFIISNYFYEINKFIPFFNLRSLIYNIRLFLPKQLVKPHPNIIFKYRLIKMAKIYKWNLIYNNKRDLKINRRQINKLLDKGKKILKEIDTQIFIKKNIINNLNFKKNVFNIISYVFPSLNENFKFNKNNNSYLKNTTMFKNNFTNLNLTKIDNDIQLSKFNKIQQNFENVNTNSNNLLLYEKKLFINKIFKAININKINEIKIEQTLNEIGKFKDFNNEAFSIYSNPVEMSYYNFNDIFNFNNRILNKNNNKDNKNNFFLTKVDYKLHNKPIINKYLKAISSYNIIKKGIFMSYSNIIGFNFKSDRNKLIQNIYKLLARSFKAMYCLISKPVFVMTPDKIIIQLFYFLFIPNILKIKKIQLNKNGKRKKISKKLWFKKKKNFRKQYRKFRKIKFNVRQKLRKLSNVVITKVFKKNFKLLSEILSHFFNKPVHLDLIRLHYPYHDSNILVNLLGIMINKIKLRIIFRKLFEKAVIKNLNKVTGKTNYEILPAFLSGINIKVAGRLLTHRVIPRKTVKTIRRGAAAPGKINFSDVARFTNKNKRGAFSITVSSGQNFF
nr:ribosomal protein S3 [Tricholoma matsutake]UIX25293.1 ribosomal protein S3 [Tricholoma matsutake]UIX25321.1 ribosomal protein S3 [Tricholoma matsutake]UIX25349.1 ribosomal protein S3 [Tricholoma matsutake]UIX25377.1 ribosomal protein S3 [Tricholoma matsutake]